MQRLTPLALFLLWMTIAVQGFGGTLPFARRELIDRRRLLSEAEFAELLALGQILPGPNVINLAAAMGDRHAGWAGAAASVAGMVVVPMLIAMALATLIGAAATLPEVRSALLGMAAAAAGLLIGTAWRMAKPMRRRAPSLAVAAAIFAAIAVLRLPLALVLLAALPVTIALHGALRRGGLP
ncbi:chromate transporter [Elioraea sp. Yellowstone]|jgi:chromate transporter|uniref:chromate transporter n=1 Tax=Elioraea sp. Yellowstone TaxID=2592070 RepID=UPI00114F3A4C|nr:chromate transporter [Elioraea sp. Yellowstone]TQF78876.1 chromate transporter [Elioraea sp. Yellowstone]